MNKMLLFLEKNNKVISLPFTTAPKEFIAYYKAYCSLKKETPDPSIMLKAVTLTASLKKSALESPEAENATVFVSRMRSGTKNLNDFSVTQEVMEAVTATGLVEIDTDRKSLLPLKITKAGEEHLAEVINATLSSIEFEKLSLSVWVNRKQRLIKVKNQVFTISSFDETLSPEAWEYISEELFDETDHPIPFKFKNLTLSPL
jgi:hypothetical protein